MVLRIAAFLGIALALLVLGFLSVFNVPVDSEALVLRGSQVQRTVGPGIQIRIPIVEQVVTEPVLRERQFIYDAPFEIQECRADLALIYRIGDLESYHAAGGDLAALGDKRRELSAALGTLPDLSRLDETAAPYADQISEHLSHLTGPAAGGLHISRVSVSVEEGCEPKRIIRQDQPARIVAEPIGTLASERALPASGRATTTDGAELQIKGIIATYEIIDETRVDRCFGRDRNHVAIRIGNLTERAMIEAIGTISLDRLAEFPSTLHTALLGNSLDQCGLALGAVDFGEATIARRQVVNCEETPVEECYVDAVVVPGFSVLSRP